MSRASCQLGPECGVTDSRERRMHWANDQGSPGTVVSCSAIRSDDKEREKKPCDFEPLRNAGGAANLRKCSSIVKRAVWTRNRGWAERRGWKGCSGYLSPGALRNRNKGTHHFTQRCGVITWKQAGSGSSVGTDCEIYVGTAYNGCFCLSIVVFIFVVHTPN